MKPEPFDAVLLLPRLRVQNANAISSPMTWGLPPPRAFTGFVHALQRRMNDQGSGLQFGSVGIVCHQFDPQTILPFGRYDQAFKLTRNPGGKDIKAPPIVEEGRTHMEVSLVITVSGDDCPLSPDQCEALAANILHEAEGMRLAGGSIFPNPRRPQNPAEWINWPDNSEDQDNVFRVLRRRLAPGFVLVGRTQLLAEHLKEMQKERAEATVLDALLDLCALHHTPPKPAISNAAVAAIRGDDAENTQPLILPTAATDDWAVSRRKGGWLVPLPIGYAAISSVFAPGEVKNARDNETPFRFVENLLSLGEWVGPHRVKTLHDLLWRDHAQPEAGLYVTHNGEAVIGQMPISTTV